MPAQVILASRSPRRRELLRQIGVDCQVVPADIDESPLSGESPVEYVIRIACRKAEAGYRQAGHPEDMPVLAADTSVILDQTILGKPRDQSDAIEMLLSLSGRCHRVLSGVALWHEGLHSRLSVSKVCFRRISRQEALAYWNSGEPADKAGGYAIQGLGALFIERLEGSYSGVMGLPLFETAELLRLAGLHLPATETITRTTPDE